MANIYEDTPDARQEGDIAVTRFRPRYRALTPEEIMLHDKIKAAADDLEKLFEGCGKSREVSLAITNLEQSVMWAVKGLTRSPQT